MDATIFRQALQPEQLRELDLARQVLEVAGELGAETPIHIVNASAAEVS